MEKLSFVLCHAAINHTPVTKILKNLKCTSELEPINMMSKCKLTNK